jgi:integrase/recombinase XerD
MLSVIQPHAITQQADIPDLIGAFHAWLYLRVGAGELAENSAAAYLRGLHKFISWCKVNGTTDLDPDTLRSWKAALLTSGYKPQSVNAWLAGCKVFFSWAVEKHYLPYNPAENVKGASSKGRNKRHVREALTDLEVRRLFAMPDTTTPAGVRDLAILSLMAYTAIRTVEVHRANLADLRTMDGHQVLDVTGKGHFEADDLAVIDDQKTQSRLYDWLAIRGNKLGPLFTSLSNRSKGARLSLRALRGIVKGYMVQAGITGNKSTHSLRHSAISKVVTGGGVVKGQSVARHESIDTTMGYYHEHDRLNDPGERFIDYGE